MYDDLRLYYEYSRITFNPFKPNRISHFYQIDQSISVLRVVCWYFSFLFIFKRNLCKQTVENLSRRRVLRRLIRFCTVCQCPIKKTLGLNGLKCNCPHHMSILPVHLPFKYVSILCIFKNEGIEILVMQQCNAIQYNTMNRAIEWQYYYFFSIPSIMYIYTSLL